MGLNDHAASSPSGLAERVRAGERAALGQAITLIESRRADHRAEARALLDTLAPHAGGAVRVGITGVPGAGKSTLIDALGSLLTQRGRKVAVLAVDPSSARTGGSILGDKTRMAQLAVDPAAFIRPSPSAGTLGGVAAKTGDALVLVEAAGFDVVLVETVGVGQSETAVADLVDTFLLLMAPATGDDLQGLKKGILERADLVAVNKADGETARAAERAAADYRAALHILAPASALWTPEVVTCSARTGQGLAALWGRIEAHRAALVQAGALEGRRARQRVAALWRQFEDRLVEAARQAPGLRAEAAALERAVETQALAVSSAVDRLLTLAKQG